VDYGSHLTGMVNSKPKIVRVINQGGVAGVENKKKKNVAEEPGARERKLGSSCELSSQLAEAPERVGEEG